MTLLQKTTLAYLCKDIRPTACFWGVDCFFLSLSALWTSRLKFGVILNTFIWLVEIMFYCWNTLAYLLSFDKLKQCFCCMRAIMTILHRTILACLCQDILPTAFVWVVLIVYRFSVVSFLFAHSSLVWCSFSPVFLVFLRMVQSFSFILILTKPLHRQI